MEVERNLECFGTFQDRPEELVVKVAAPDVAVDHCSLEAVFADHAVQLVGSSFRGHGRQSGEPRETARVASHRVCKDVVCFVGELHCLGRVELIHAGGCQRQYLHIDTCRVHIRDPAFPEIAQLIK